MAQNPDMPGGQEVTLVNENIEVSPNGQNRRGRSVPPLMEDDNTLRTWAPQVVRYVTTDPAGNTVVKEVIALAETNGRATVLLYGSDGTNQDALATNVDRQLITSEGSPMAIVHDPIELTNADAAILTSTASTIFWMFVTNFHASSAAVVDIGIDVDGSAGALTQAGSIIRNYRLVPGENTGWMGPFKLTAADDLRGLADANNVASIHLLLKASSVT